MKVLIKEVRGNWDLGYALDKHVVRSTFVGNNEQGHPIFNTERTEVGEALFRLKYRQDWSQVKPLAEQIAVSLFPWFNQVGLIVPMPASKPRPRQPVAEIARLLGQLVGPPVFDDFLVKAASNAQLKNISTRDDKLMALRGVFSTRHLRGNGRWNALLIDDLFDTGASAEAACAALKENEKIGKVYFAALTWK